MRRRRGCGTPPHACSCRRGPSSAAASVTGRKPVDPQSPSAGDIMLISKLCRYADFQQAWYLRWAETLGLEQNSATTEPDRRNIHRKAWEWCAIAETLQQRGL